MKANKLLAAGGAFAGFAVALGAFASHGLKAMLSPYLLEVFNIGVQYQFIHALAIIACAILMMNKVSVKAQKYFFLAAICFIIGIFCFSGSLYALALSGIKWFGPITPLGGMTFMIGWVLFVYAALQNNRGE
ncbi:hypothetical protein VII00023_20932 [Vibrio ichthyoenteri ATCC 700023]|uniref:DUF423 domain-containing protein n=1 Tax=Vibrio ichthyoenteri ATCC 700023 TaxID=870968 RepID=F9RX96_9VIBR|nr:DUF423 domain-containing protein [Vibrio ichthyoenteri]EGU48219.1 hypothetical protein VII00023_20932 [Vibrio ichthyoenteri ATCC 700023]